MSVLPSVSPSSKSNAPRLTIDTSVVGWPLLSSSRLAFRHSRKSGSASCRSPFALCTEARPLIALSVAASRLPCLERCSITCEVVQEGGGRWWKVVEGGGRGWKGVEGGAWRYRAVGGVGRCWEMLEGVGRCCLARGSIPCEVMEGQGARSVGVRVGVRVRAHAERDHLDLLDEGAHPVHEA